jgi:hypothetical protein
MSPKHISILGSTGSIGTQALDVLRSNPGAFEIDCLTAQNNAELLIKQAKEFCPGTVVIGNEEKYAVVRDALQRHLPPNAQRSIHPQVLAPGQGTFTAADESSPYPDSEGQTRTRVSLRLTLADADELQRRAQTAGLSLAAWVLHVMRSGQEPISAEHRAARIAALTQSNGELATLARNIGHLSALLRQGEVRAAQEYRQMLDSVAADVRQHLKLAAQVLAAERKQTQTQPAAPRGDTHD